MRIIRVKDDPMNVRRFRDALVGLGDDPHSMKAQRLKRLIEIGMSTNYEPKEAAGMRLDLDFLPKLLNEYGQLALHDASVRFLMHLDSRARLMEYGSLAEQMAQAEM